MYEEKHVEAFSRIKEIPFSKDNFVIDKRGFLSKELPLMANIDAYSTYKGEDGSDRMDYIIEIKHSSSDVVMLYNTYKYQPILYAYFFNSRNGTLLCQYRYKTGDYVALQFPRQPEREDEILKVVEIFIKGLKNTTDEQDVQTVKDMLAVFEKNQEVVDNIQVKDIKLVDYFKPAYNMVYTTAGQRYPFPPLNLKEGK